MSEQESKELPQIEGSKEVLTTKPVLICTTHTKDEWQKQEYIDNKDGTVSCQHCVWGTTLPGYMRVSNGKIVDLRSLTQ
jgi:hypothetical protein